MSKKNKAAKPSSIICILTNRKTLKQCGMDETKAELFGLLMSNAIFGKSQTDLCQKHLIPAVKDSDVGLMIWPSFSTA